MPITRSAKKALRAASRKKMTNDRRSRAMKDVVKDIRKLITDKNGSDASAKLSATFKAIDKAAKRGVIKKTTAARKKSRLAHAIAKLA